eukprot:TRINITY_DN27001_c0_g1_i1.p1 TRINITY_DN27001_c0_g1~~TRINITY_DN27001_c0_g1_i1.p1  ORF type:complete len:622 (-),score=127.09 TRINITY_DN27001_c0_g1_i1:261-1949(-)
MDAVIAKNETYFSPEQVEMFVSYADVDASLSAFFDVVTDVKHFCKLVRVTCFLYLFVLMLKFFKCFKANMRLDVVIKTLTLSAIDVGHFMIVFFTVFCSYAWAGQLLWGQKIKGFGTSLDSLFFCWRGGVGMGDIEEFPLAVQVLCYTWAMSYQLLVIWLMLSILIGLIFEAYGRIRAQAGSPLTLIQQINEAINDLRQEKGFLDLWYMICELEDDDFPAHPQPICNVRSLKKAFEKDRMTRENAEYLLRKASLWTRSKKGNVNLSLSDAIRIIGQIRLSSLRVSELTERVKIMIRTDVPSADVAAGNAQLAVAEVANKPAPDSQPMSPVSPTSPWSPKDKSKTGKKQNEISMLDEVTVDEYSDSDEERIAKQSEMDRLDKAVRDRNDQLAKELQDFRDFQTASEAMIEEELRAYHQEMHDRGVFLHKQIDILSEHADGSDACILKLSNQLKDADMIALQGLPDKLAELVQLVELSRGALEKGERGHGADPLKVLEQHVHWLSEQLDEVVNKAKQQKEFGDMLEHVNNCMTEIPIPVEKVVEVKKTANVRVISSSSSDSGSA